MQAEAFVQPAEWAPQGACWTAFPPSALVWGDSFAAARHEVAQLCALLGAAQPLRVLVSSDADGAELTRRVADIDPAVQLRLHRVPFGDIWLRDTGPIFVHGRGGEVVAARFAFNGWGDKYLYPDDLAVSGVIAELSGLRQVQHGWVLEGGSVDVDGAGTALTSRQCLLNPNRNPAMSQAAVAEALHTALGARHVVWVEEGLRNDHTDGHIDTLARFVGPATVAAMRPAAADPNAAALVAVAAALRRAHDAQGRPLNVVEVPSPGAVLSDDGALLPASYLNFIVANDTVVVPTYGSPQDAAAVAAVGALFAGRRCVGSPAAAILSGGGAFHCITQQQPAPARPAAGAA